MNGSLPEQSQSAPSSAEMALARACAPLLMLCETEPFRPERFGLSVLRAPGRAVSVDVEIAFAADAVKVLEYAVWWDWSMRHLSGLEPLWLHLGANDAIVAVDALRDGALVRLEAEAGGVPVNDGRLVLFCEPGTHGFHAHPNAMEAQRHAIIRACQADTSHEPSIAAFAGLGTARGPEDHRVVRRHLEACAFTPSFAFSHRVDLSQCGACAWPTLAAYIAMRVPELVALVRTTQPLIKAVLFDCGDTFIDETSEVRDADDSVREAALFPGARAALKALVADGYRLALVADGSVTAFDTMLAMHALDDVFEARIVSQSVGRSKPDPAMFEAALAALGLDAQDAGSVVMIGNNLARDIKGANRQGMISVWQTGSRRRSRVPADADEVPDYCVARPAEIPARLARIERDLATRHTRAALAAQSVLRAE